MLTSIAGNGQGIVFEKGAWQDILARARSLNRPIFIDLYTTWCGPCKKMDRDIFSLKEVGNRFNASFVNYKIDAEKGEGIELAKKYRVDSYPTYLFVTGEEVLVYRSLGAMPEEKFLAEASIAVAEFKDPKPLASWEDDYERKKTDPEFLYSYLQKRKKLRLNSADLLDQYYRVIGREAMMKSALLPDLGSFLNLNSDGPFYSFLKEDPGAIKKSIFDMTGRNVLMNEYLIVTARNDIERAVERHDESLAEHIAATLVSLPPDEWPLEWRAYDTKMKYYSQTRQPEPLGKVLKAYTASLLAYDRKKVSSLDSALAAKFDQDLAAGKFNSMKAEMIPVTRQARASQNGTQFAFRLRDAAKAAFLNFPDKEHLREALKWNEAAASYSDNFTIEETRASLLYRIGDQKAAVDSQRKAIAQFTRQMQNMNITNEKIQKRLEGSLMQMESGKPTWD